MNYKTPIILLLVVSAVLKLSSARTSGRITYCNPIDIDYKYNFEQMHERISYRSGADPVILLHRGKYVLFSTISGGWWVSDDLIHWEYVVPDRWPFQDMCAPAALSVHDTLFLIQSTYERVPLFYITDPTTGRLEFYNRFMPWMPGARGPWDPALFRDPKSRRWFLFFGSSNLYPIYGIELNKSDRLNYMGQAREFIFLNPERHGWERFGPNHTGTIDPFIEGAWMTGHKGRYYLQYAAPGTEYNVYANGTYVGDNPFGPFEYAPYNPVSYKPGGFMRGAGHGNTFLDRSGNYWNTGTPWVAVNWNFERRIAMFPAGFDADGQMFSNTRFGDFPHYVPSRRWRNKDELFTGWMLLSYRKPCTASSQLDTFSVTNVTDEKVRSYWVARRNQPGEWIEIDLQKSYTLRALQVNFADYKSAVYQSDSTVYTQFRIQVSADRKNWQIVADLSHEKRDRPNAYIELAGPLEARYVKYEHIYVASRHLAVSDIRVFGTGHGKPPPTPRHLTVRRDKDQRNAFVSWQSVPGAVGYNILWGIKADKLYQTWQVFADQGNQLEVRALNVGQDYYFAIEAFDENGVSALSGVKSAE